MRPDRKITVRESEWIWAIKRDCAKEYYKSKYASGSIELTPKIGGSIVGPMLRENLTLLSIAYNCLSIEWQTIRLVTHDMFYKAYTNPNAVDFIDFKDFTWMMFLTLGCNLEVSVLDEIVDGDWKSRWDELDNDFHHTFRKEDIVSSKAV